MKWTQRMPDELFEQFKAIADNDGMSINAAFNQAVKMYIARDRTILEQKFAQLEAKFATLAESGGSSVVEEHGKEKWRQCFDYHQKRLDVTWETVLKLIKRVDYLEGVETEDVEDEDK